MSFPDGFLWGSATASYQIEGAVAEDGRGPSIWDVFSHTPGNVANGDTGDVACDHYHRADRDLDLMADLGLGAYRFSIAWPRVKPEGRGPVNQRGLDFYSRLVDGLLARGITPMATLYHWDLPQALEDRGGWRNRDTAGWFADYAEVVHDALGDRVPLWVTLNEPYVFCVSGYGRGEHAPGVAAPAAAYAASHHALLGHGLAVQAMRAGDHATRIGITYSLSAVSAVTDDEADRDAARAVDGLLNRLYLDPVLRGAYAEDVLADAGDRFPSSLRREGDLAVISEPIDHVGVNYYTRQHVRAGDDDWLHADYAPARTGQPTTAMGWGIDPEGLTELLVRLDRDYPGTVWYVTENGAAFDDEPDDDGFVEDRDRIAYVEAHLRAVSEAIDAGVDVRGYFLWSLLDNFEWAEGYAKRFGIVRVDYRTLTRTPKASARWYAEVISRGALT